MKKKFELYFFQDTSDAVQRSSGNVNEEKLSYDGLTDGLETAGFNVEAHVILRLLEIARKYDVRTNEAIIKFAKRVAVGSIDMTFVDEFETSLEDTKDEDEAVSPSKTTDKEISKEIFLDFCDLCTKSFFVKKDYDEHMARHPNYKTKSKDSEEGRRAESNDHETQLWFSEKVI